MNTDYKILLEEMLIKADSFSLVVRDTLELKGSGKKILDKLNPFLLKEDHVSKWPGTELLMGKAKYYSYSLNNRSIEILSEINSLFDWQQPEFPEDLTFYRKDKIIFVSISHEKDSWYVE